MNKREEEKKVNDFKDSKKRAIKAARELGYFFRVPEAERILKEAKNASELQRAMITIRNMCY